MQTGLAQLVQLKLHLLQMLPVDRLSLHFKNLSNGQVVQIPQSTKDRSYPVVGARRVTAPYGHTIMFTLRTEGDILLRICLPKRYANDIDDVDIDDMSG